MRAAIWSAVSTTAQASPDKVSISLQLQKGRELIASKGWDLVGEYVVPGESRTRYISLYHAEKEIAPLHDLLEAAQRREFDILYVYDLNRFRHLMRQVFDALSDYNIQLYIHTNPREPVPPALYTEEQKNAVGMIVDLANIISRSEISNIQRHFREKMPERIKKGLDARLGGIKYGYKKIHPLDKHTPLILDPPKARIAVQIKDWYLAGASLYEIAARLNVQNTPAPAGKKWYPVSVRNVLASPFYAGIVYFGRTKNTRDRRTGAKRTIPNPAPTYAQGKHPPLWSAQEHQLIMDTLEKRGNGYKGTRTARFSSLLRCECGAVLHLDRNKAGGLPHWRCSSKIKKHTFITHAKAKELIIPQIIEAIRTMDGLTLPQTEPEDPTLSMQAELKDLERRQEKLMELYEDEKIDIPTLKTRLDKINARLDLTRSLIVKTQTLAARKQSTRQTIHNLQQLIDQLPVYYMTAPPAQVNASLRTVIESITVTRAHRITIHWRE